MKGFIVYHMHGHDGFYQQARFSILSLVDLLRKEGAYGRPDPGIRRSAQGICLLSVHANGLYEPPSGRGLERAFPVCASRKARGVKPRHRGVWFTAAVRQTVIRDGCAFPMRPWRFWRRPAKAVTRGCSICTPAKAL